jgi:hypothetical protein
MLCLLAQVAIADDQAIVQAPTSEALPVDLSPLLSVPAGTVGTHAGALSNAILPDSDFDAQSAAGLAPAPELAAGLNVQVTQKRRKFRTRAVDWMSDRSTAAGTMTDFLLGGADSGWHLYADVTGTDEYVLEWKARFR